MIFSHLFAICIVFKASIDCYIDIQPKLAATKNIKLFMGIAGVLILNMGSGVLTLKCCSRLCIEYFHVETSKEPKRHVLERRLFADQTKKRATCTGLQDIGYENFAVN